MRALIQRVSRAEVRVAGRTVGAIGAGFVVLLGATHDDGEAAADWTARKIAELRVLADAEGRMNLSLLDTQGAVLLLSQFTLYRDAPRGRPPQFVKASRHQQCSPLDRRISHQ